MNNNIINTICLVTPHNVYNYGALLQAYALSTYLKTLGVKVLLYDFPINKWKRNSFRERIYSLLIKISKYIWKKRLLEGKKEFDTFIKEFPLTQENNFSIYLVGSDQVWNPGNLNDYFSLKFAPDAAFKFSYAASIGIKNISPEYEKKFVVAMQRLQLLSAREVDAAGEVERLTNRKCLVHLDPSFLLSVNEWQSNEVEYNINEPYILIYLLHIPKDINKILNIIKKKYKKTIYIIDQRGFLHYCIRGALPIIDAGPRQFLWLIHHADLIITSSFHGTAFSIIYNKPFLPLINLKSPSRIKNLLEICGIDSNIDNPIDFIQQLNYSTINSNLNKKIHESEEYLKYALQEAKKWQM